MLNNEQIKNLVDSYLKLMDEVPYGDGMFFKNKSQKDDLETKVWHFLHKIDAASYHELKIKKVAEGMRDKLRDFMQREDEGFDSHIKSMQTFEVESKDILFEVDSFFTAGRSALDFLASILSRYIKGKETDRISRCIKFFKEDTTFPEIKRKILDMWTEWGEDFVEYRNYLVHNGALNPPKAIATKVFRNKNLNETRLNEIAVIQDIMDKHILSRGSEFIVFPLPKKPDKSLRITRMNRWFEREVCEMPEGFSKEEYGGSIQIGEEKVEARRVRYVLDYRYLEADELCSKYYNCLLCFFWDIFSELIGLNFKFIM